MDTAEDFEQKRKTVAGEKKKADKNWLQHWRHNIEIKARSCLKDVGKSAISTETKVQSESLNDSFSNQFYQLITESEDLFNNVIKLQIYQAFN